MKLLKTLYYYRRARRLKFQDRELLEEYQQKRFSRFKRTVLEKSPYFHSYLDLPFHQWPLMNKKIMMTHFDQMNTAGLSKSQLLECALQSEQSRNFTPKVGKYSVGLSSGTSGQRGLFVTDPREQQVWAGTMLAKVLPRGLFSGERIALFLRADNNLYHSVNNRWLSFEFFDLLADFDRQIERLVHYRPTLVVAPAQVLRAITLLKKEGSLNIHPHKVISVAEVLEPQDRELLNEVFPDWGEIYQATEGFLGTTCSHGTLHLNEEFVLFEQKKLDERRFIPIITDFTRSTQPIVRYQLDDILIKREEPCPCGSCCLAIDRIEGRHDDQPVLLDKDGNEKTVFADPCSRIIANSLPLECDYRLIQTGPARLKLIAGCDIQTLENCSVALNNYFDKQGVDVSGLHWELESRSVFDPSFDKKRRRIIRLNK